MSPADARVHVLAAELERDFLEVQRRTSRSARVDPAASEPEAAYVALEIDHAYQAFESLVVRLERSLGLASRDGAEWHRRLLEDAARPVAGLRPVVVPVEALDASIRDGSSTSGARSWRRQSRPHPPSPR